MRSLLDLPLGELLARARDVRDAATGTRVTYSPKVFIPLTMLCRDKCGYCTFAQPPARLDAPLPVARGRARDRPGRGARRGATRRSSPSASAPEERYPVAAEWLAEHGYASTVDYLVGHVPPGARRDRPAPPRQRRRPLRGRAGPAARGRPQPGDDDRDPPRRPRRPPRLARQDARAPPGHPRGRRRAAASRSPPGSSSASARTGRTASPRSRPSPPRTAARATCRR